MRTITVSRKELKAAMDSTKEISNEWPAQILEILLIPKVYARWQELNQNESYRIFRHTGKQPYIEYAAKPENWLDVGGYEFKHPTLQAAWNFAKSEYYAHSAHTAWNGIARNTICLFAESLRGVALGHECYNDDEYMRRAKIKVK